MHFNVYKTHMRRLHIPYLVNKRIEFFKYKVRFSCI